MNNFKFSQRSKGNLKGVHPDLVWVCARGLILSPIDFIVTEGVRTLERQKMLKAEGKSKTLKSLHLRQEDGYGHAFDIVALKGASITWDSKYYKPIADAMFQAAKELGVKITWGGSWGWDSPHFQLDESPNPHRSSSAIVHGFYIAAVE